MRKLLLISIALLLISTVYSQQINNFKNQVKKNLGATAPSFTFKTISNIQRGKSSLISPNKSFTISSTLQQPALQVNDSIRNLVVVSGKPIYFEKAKNRIKIQKIESTEDKFYSFFNSTLQNTKLNNPKEELQITQSTTDNLGIIHVKAQQYYKGVKIYGAESYLHIGTQKDIFTGKIYSTDSIASIIPKITKETALTSATNDLKTRTTFRSLSVKEKELLQYDLPIVSLVIFENILSYEISIRPNFIQEWKYFLSASDGKIISFYNNTHSDSPTTANAYDLSGTLRTINTYLQGSTYMLFDASEPMFNLAAGDGAIMTLNANNTSTANLQYSTITSTNNTWNIPSSISAHYNATLTYKYFKNTFGRNSINGQGGNIISLVNVTEEDGSAMDNAFWNGQVVCYGNGNLYFKPLAAALDVTAHEFGHGVISNTANLEYQGQSGAMNESFADIFGAMVDRSNWLIGESITKTTFSPSGALRNMANPHNMGNSSDPFWQPQSVSEMYLGSSDNGGVHLNSGIINYAYYLFATAITKDKSEQVFYRALTNYLTSKSQFIDLRIAVVQSTKDLFGDNSQEVIEAKKAFDAVGIYEEVQINPAQDYPVNPGQDYLLINNTDVLDANTLYKSTTTASTFNALTSTKIKGKVSVTDDGGWAVFVSSDSKIRAISTDPANPQESIISNDGIWDNVVISKDGNRLACITTAVDTAIYVYDFVASKWGKFKLYNPTTSSNGTNAGGVLYANALEFDHTGEYLIYDAYNVLNSTSGSNISYWDIGFIKVWDKTTNSFGDGSINKLYGSLPEKVSVGNPTFSKNSPYIIAFDYLNSSTNEFAVFGANLLTGKLGLISTNSTIGFPSFSKNDDKIAFSTLNSSSKESIATISLAADKITGSGSSSIIIIDAKWPIFYTQGIRTLNLAPIANFTADYKSGVAPLSVKYFDLSVNEPTSWDWSFPGGTPLTSTLQNPTVVYKTAGIYQASLTCYNSAGNNIITKTSYISVTSNTALNVTKSNLFSFYPNPTKDKLFVQSENDFRLKLYSLSGNLLIDLKNNKEVDLSKLTNGLYILQIECDGKILKDKLLKQ